MLASFQFWSLLRRSQWPLSGLNYGRSFIPNLSWFLREENLRRFNTEQPRRTQWNKALGPVTCCKPPRLLEFLSAVRASRRGEYETGSPQSADLHTLMKAAIIGHNWFFSLSLWLSHNWVWTSPTGGVIDSGLNSSLFSSNNNYAAIWTCKGDPLTSPPPPLPPPPPPPLLFVMRGIISAVFSNLSPTIHGALLSEKVGAGWKMSPQRGTWRCEIADSSLPSAVCLKRYFFFYWQSGLNVCWPARHILLQPWLLLFPGHLLSIAATFSISQGLLYEDRKLRHQPLPGKCT